MTTVNERAADRRGGLRFDFFRRAAIGVAVALVGLMAATGPAFAAASADGTSNTIQLAVTSAVLDQAHHRMIVTAPAAGGVAGRHLALVEVVTPQLKYVFSDVMVESLAGTSSESLSLNYTKIEFKASGGATCMPGVDACLIEGDGIWLPGG
jgi:hypothetical protein